MFFKPKKNRADADLQARLDAFASLCRTQSPANENYFDSLKSLLTIFSAQVGSIYVYEQKAGVFLLKKWEGQQPRSMSIAAAYEFIDYLKNRRAPVWKNEFSDSSAPELRQPALVYFQNTATQLACAVMHDQECLALLNIGWDAASNDEDWMASLMQVYAQNLATHLRVRGLIDDNLKLSEISHVKNQLLANVTHELKTPLNGILGFSEALLDGSFGALDAGVCATIETIIKSGKQLSETVDGLLNLVQIEARKGDFRPRKLDLVQLASEIVALFDDVMKEHNNRFVYEAHQEPIYAFVEPDQIRTVFMNLLNNALKFTRDGTVRLEIQRSGGMVRVSVADTGIGIDEDKTELIFEEFYQADGSATRVYGGTGLGLAIARKIIALHGGRIWAESKKGMGSRFTFTLPHTL